jgi:hypothetical protein
MRLLRWLLLVLVLAALPAKANTLTSSDFDAAAAINRALLVALRDIATAGKAMQGVSADSDCVQLIMHDVETVQSNTQHLMTLILIGLASNETGVLEPIKIAVDGMITEFKTVRGHLNQLSGQCSRFPLPVAKAQQALQLLDRANSIAKRVLGQLGV